MQIGRFVEVLEIVPDETPGLGQDSNARREDQGGQAPAVGAGFDCVDEAKGRRAAYAS